MPYIILVWKLRYGLPLEVQRVCIVSPVAGNPFWVLRSALWAVLSARLDSLRLGRWSGCSWTAARLKYPFSVQPDGFNSFGLGHSLLNAKSTQEYSKYLRWYVQVADAVR